MILLVRGGGSIEDLWCFNDETLARYIYIMNTPVVTGIGHEIDFTLCDYTADVRANTPTGAVEKAVPDLRETEKILNQYEKRLTNTAVISSVLFSVLSVAPCCMIGYFFTLLSEYDDLTDLFLHSLVFIVVPLVFLVLFAVGCFDGVRDEYRRYTTFKQTFMEESIEANK